jgi:hypothetical protein
VTYGDNERNDLYSRIYQDQGRRLRKLYLMAIRNQFLVDKQIEGLDLDLSHLKLNKNYAMLQ